MMYSAWIYTESLEIVVENLDTDYHKAIKKLFNLANKVCKMWTVRKDQNIFGFKIVGDDGQVLEMH